MPVGRVDFSLSQDTANPLSLVALFAGLLIKK